MDKVREAESQEVGERLSIIEESFGIVDHSGVIWDTGTTQVVVTTKRDLR